MRWIPRTILVIAVLAAVFSATYSFYHHDRPRSDALGYDRIAWNLARGNGYIEDETNVGRPQDDWAINRVGPGYEFFLAGLYTLFGHRIWVVWIAHALLRALSVVLIWMIAGRLFPQKRLVAVGAAALFAFSPDLILISSFLLTETLYLFLFLGTLLVILRYFESPDSFRAGIAGMLLASALLVRPTTLFVLFLFWGVLLVRRRWTDIIYAALVPIVLVGSWSVFATFRYDRFILTTGVGAYDLWVGNNPHATGGFEKAPEVQGARGILSQQKLDRVSKEKYWEFLTTNPLQFFELQMRKTALYFSALHPTGYWPHLYNRLWELRITLAASAFWTAFLLVFGVTGIFLLWARKDVPMRFFLASAFLQPLAVIPIIVESRYRYPFFLFLIFFGAYAVMQSRLGKKALISACIIVGVMTLYDFWAHTADIIEKLKRVF